MKNIQKYSLTKGINEKKYRFINDQVIENLPKINDWLNDNFLKDNNILNWNESIINLHKSVDEKNNQSKSFRRIVFDEICANFLTLSENRKRIKKTKKNKVFSESISKEILKILPFKLTSGQKNSLNEINLDLRSGKECLGFYKEM